MVAYDNFLVGGVSAGGPTGNRKQRRSPPYSGSERLHFLLAEREEREGFEPS